MALTSLIMIPDGFSLAPDDKCAMVNKINAWNEGAMLHSTLLASIIVEKLKPTTQYESRYCNFCKLCNVRWGGGAACGGAACLNHCVCRLAVSVAVPWKTGLKKRDMKCRVVEMCVRSYSPAPLFLTLTTNWAGLRGWKKSKSNPQIFYPSNHRLPLSVP